MTFWVSTEDISDGDLDWALRDAAEGIESEASPSNVVAVSAGEFPAGALARKLRNLFCEKSLLSAKALLENPNPDIRCCAEEFMEERKQAEGVWCMNPKCLRFLAKPMPGKRGRKRKYCTDACQAAAGVRRWRDKKDPARGAVARDFELPRYVRPGFGGPSGFRRKRASVFGFDSLITPEIQAQRHRAAVAGQSGAESALRALLGDREWERVKPKQMRSNSERNRQAARDALAEFDAD